MKYAITNKDKVIGPTELERSDLSMGFVFGVLELIQLYALDINETDYTYHTSSCSVVDSAHSRQSQCSSMLFAIRPFVA